MAVQVSRREWLRRSLATGAAAPMIIRASALGRDGVAAPSERITLGFIGCGRQSYLQNIPLFVRTAGVQPLALCDVDSWRLANAVQQVKNQYDSGRAKGNYSGYRGTRP